MEKKMMPIGVEDFAKIRTDNYYYVDKTGLIKELLGNRGEVNLFTGTPHNTEYRSPRHIPGFCLRTV